MSMDVLLSPQEIPQAFKSYLSTRVDHIVILSLVAALVHLWVSWPRKAAIPVLSHYKGWTAPWKDAVRYLKDSPGVLQEGYQRVSDDDCRCFCISHGPLLTSIVLEESCILPTFHADALVHRCTAEVYR